MRPLHSRRARTKLEDAHLFRTDGFLSMGTDDYLSDAERNQIAEGITAHLFETTKLNFPKTNNLEYAVLKAHLIIEDMLTHYIRGMSYVLVEPEQIRFSFSQKLEIAILHGFGNGCPTTVPSVELLNRVRNQVAHRFSIDRSLVDELIRINSDDVDVAALSDRQRVSYLRVWCYSICGNTAGHLEVAIFASGRVQR